MRLTIPQQNRSLTGAPERGDVTLELCCPPFGETDWLRELRQMRGRIIYDHGRRPSFLTSGGCYDPEPMDYESFHVLGRSSGCIVGCTRIMPLRNLTCSMISSAIGWKRFEDVMNSLSLRPAQVAEASRWMALPEYRGDFGRELVAATWAVVRWLSIDACFVLAGTAEHQDVALIRMGARPVGPVALIHSSELDDSLRLLHFDVPRPPVSMLGRIDAAAAGLHLE